MATTAYQIITLVAVSMINEAQAIPLLSASIIAISTAMLVPLLLICQNLF